MGKRISDESLQAFAAAMKSVNWRNPEERLAVAIEIILWVQEDVYSEDIVSLISDTRDFNEGESVEFHTLRPLQAYIHEPGSFAPRAQLIKDVVTLPTQLVSVAAELDIGQLRSGRYGTLLDLRTKAAEALLGQRNKLVWETAYGAITSGNADGNYASFASGDTAAVKRAALDTAIDYVHDNGNGGPTAIIGRHSALTWVQDLGNNYFSDARKDEIMNTGFLGMYRGTPIYRLRSYKDQDGNQKINASNILITANGNIKFGQVRPGLEVFEQLNGTRSRNWEIAFWEKYGVAVVNPEEMYRLEIT
jgi:hypothetical protein